MADQDTTVEAEALKKAMDEGTIDSQDPEDAKEDDHE